MKKFLLMLPIIVCATGLWTMDNESLPNKKYSEVIWDYKGAILAKLPEPISDYMNGDDATYIRSNVLKMCAKEYFENKIKDTKTLVEIFKKCVDETIKKMGAAAILGGLATKELDERFRKTIADLDKIIKSLKEEDYKNIK